MSSPAQTVLILAAGDSSRWCDYRGIPKQLIRIGDQAILERTIQQVRTFGIEPILVTNDTRLHLNDCEVVAPVRCNQVIDTLESTRDHWTSRNVVLLGDVFFTDRAINRILKCDASLSFFGRAGPSWFSGCRHGELFGLVFHESQIARLLRATSVVRTWAARGGRCKIWAVYRQLAGIPLNQDRLEVERQLFCSINDATDDFDTPEDYNRSIRRYQRLVRSWKCFVPALYALARTRAMVRSLMERRRPAARDARQRGKGVDLARMDRPNGSQLRITLDAKRTVHLEVYHPSTNDVSRKALTIPIRKWPALFEMIQQADKALQRELAGQMTSDHEPGVVKAESGYPTGEERHKISPGCLDTANAAAVDRPIPS